jgi:NNP family nitrate/nitrite transporter-like MFS transporter
MMARAWRWLGGGVGARGQRVGKLGWLGGLVLCAALGLHNASRIAPVPLIEEFRFRYGADYAAVGSVIGAYTLSYALAQLVAGLLTDRLGSLRLVEAGVLVMALGSGLFAVTSSYPVAVAGRLLMGVAGGLLYVPALSYMLAAFGRAQRGKAMGLAQGGIGAAIVLSVLLMPPLFLALGLTGAYLTFPIVSVLLWAGLTWLVPEIPAEVQHGGGSVLALARDRDFWLLFMGFAFVGMLAQTSVLSWLPTYLRQEFEFGVAEAGAAGALVSAGLMVFAPIFGLLADRLGSHLRVMLIGSAIGLLGFVGLLLAHDPILAIAAGLLVSAGMAATITMQIVYAGERFAAIGAGAAVAIVNTGGQLSQSLDGPFYGTILDLGYGFSTVWLIAAVLGLVRLVAVLLLREQPAPASPNEPA